jgi:hypothetical protein
MKSALMFVLSAFALTSVAHASDSVAIKRFIYIQGLTVDRIQYRVNVAKGRAWAKIETSDPGLSYDDTVNYQSVDVQVPGLAYEGSQIVFAGSAGKVVCADVVSTSRKLLIRPTGLCRFTTARGSSEIDNGFESHFESTLDVHFSAH